MELKDFYQECKLQRKSMKPGFMQGPIGLSTHVSWAVAGVGEFS